MGKSFILKDRTGTPSGYLLQGIRTLRCRISGAEEGMKAVLFYADGKHSERQITTLDGEIEWEEPNAFIDGVVIIKDDAIVADSGVQAKRRFESMQIKANRGEEQGNAAALSVGKPEESLLSASMDGNEKKPEKREKEWERSLSERRWPRPPCLQTAVYDHGAWKERC